MSNQLELPDGDDRPLPTFHFDWEEVREAWREGEKNARLAWEETRGMREPSADLLSTRFRPNFPERSPDQ